MTESKAETFIFAPYRLDPGQRLLSRDGQPVSLTPKEFDTLLVLVEAAGNVVGKEELITRVWPDSYVGNGSLARNISVLRKALGEDVIETLPRRGYRIKPPVASLPSNGTVSSVESARADAEALAQLAVLADVREAAPQWRRRFLVGSVSLAVLLAAAVTSRFFANTAKAHLSAKSTRPIQSILIEKRGAIDPLDEAFKLAGRDRHYLHTLYNRESNGWDRWRIITDDQNFYYRALSENEREFALQTDWTLTCVCALERGGGFADIDLGGKGPRFDIEFLQEGDRYFVALTKQISPRIEMEPKIEFPGVADVAHPHTYELRYDHLSRTASLWIDGQLMASAYPGHHQFQEGLGLMFGAAIYGDAATSSMVFRTVRFEAH
jgi:DNA-binding winged helix-turn-helix (wHTH) protein